MLCAILYRLIQVTQSNRAVGSMLSCLSHEKSNPNSVEVLSNGSGAQAGIDASRHGVQNQTLSLCAGYLGDWEHRATLNYPKLPKLHKPCGRERERERGREEGRGGEGRGGLGGGVAGVAGGCLGLENAKTNPPVSAREWGVGFGHFWWGEGRGGEEKEGVRVKPETIVGELSICIWVQTTGFHVTLGLA